VAKVPHPSRRRMPGSSPPEAGRFDCRESRIEPLDGWVHGSPSVTSEPRLEARDRCLNHSPSGPPVGTMMPPDDRLRCLGCEFGCRHNKAEGSRPAGIGPYERPERRVPHGSVRQLGPKFCSQSRRRKKTAHGRLGTTCARHIRGSDYSRAHCSAHRQGHARAERAESAFALAAIRHQHP